MQTVLLQSPLRFPRCPPLLHSQSSTDMNHHYHPLTPSLPPSFPHTSSVSDTQAAKKWFFESISSSSFACAPYYFPLPISLPSPLSLHYRICASPTIWLPGWLAGYLFLFRHSSPYSLASLYLRLYVTIIHSLLFSTVFSEHLNQEASTGKHSTTTPPHPHTHTPSSICSLFQSHFLLFSTPSSPF